MEKERKNQPTEREREILLKKITSNSLLFSSLSSSPVPFTPPSFDRSIFDEEEISDSNSPVCVRRWPMESGGAAGMSEEINEGEKGAYVLRRDFIYSERQERKKERKRSSMITKAFPEDRRGEKGRRTRIRRNEGGAFDGNRFGRFLFDRQEFGKSRSENEKTRKFLQIGMNLFRSVTRQGDVLQETNHSIPIETTTGRFHQVIEFFQNLTTSDRVGGRQTIEHQLTHLRSKSSGMNAITRIDDVQTFTMDRNQTTRRTRQHFTKHTNRQIRSERKRDLRRIYLDFFFSR